jgi:hypothetical protein
VVERDRHQPGLFDAQPALGDVAAAQPLHADTGPGGRGSGPPGQGPNQSANDASEVTVKQTTRRAEILAELRAQIDARTAAAGERRRTRHDDLDEHDGEDQGIGYGHSDDAYLSDSEQADQGFGLST